MGEREAISLDSECLAWKPWIFEETFETTPAANCSALDGAALWASVAGGFNASSRITAPTVPAIVYVAVTVMTFVEVDELRSTVTGLVYMSKSWTDKRLRQEPCAMASLPALGLPLSRAQLAEVWEPSVGVVSALKTSRPASPETFDQTLVSRSASDGNLYLTNTQAILLTIPCVANFYKFPFDTTDCELVFSTPRSHPSLTEIRWWPGSRPLTITRKFNTLASHYVLGTKAIREQVSGVLGHNYTADVIHILFHRYAIFYVLQGYVPNVITVLVSSFSFTIKPDAVPARVSIVVSSLIAIMLQYANLVKTIPKVGYFKSIDVWNLVCTSFIFSASAEYAVICFLKRQPRKVSPSTLARIDKAAAVVLLGFFALFSLIYFALVST